MERCKEGHIGKQRYDVAAAFVLLTLIIFALVNSSTCAAAVDGKNTGTKTLIATKMFFGTIPGGATIPGGVAGNFFIWPTKILNSTATLKIKLHIEQRSDVLTHLSQRTAAKCTAWESIYDARSNNVRGYKGKSEKETNRIFSRDSWKRYSLDAGDYVVAFICLGGEFRTNPDVQFSFYYTATPLRELPIEALSFKRWLIETGLEKHIRLSGFYRVAETQSVSATTSPWVSEAEAKRINRDYLMPESITRYLIVETQKPLKQPKLSLLLTFISDGGRDVLSSFEYKMIEVFNEDLTAKLLRTAAGFSGIPKSSVALSISTYCKDEYRFFEGQELSGGETICMSSSVGVDLPDVNTTIASAFIESIEAPHNPIGNFEDRLRQYFVGQGGQLRILDREINYLEFIVRGTRGLIVSGNTDWERLQVAISLLGAGQERRLRINADGFLGSGFRPPASDIGYDRSMEPQYAQALTLFVRNLATQLKMFQGSIN